MNHRLVTVVDYPKWGEHVDEIGLTFWEQTLIWFENEYPGSTEYLIDGKGFSGQILFKTLDDKFNFIMRFG